MQNHFTLFIVRPELCSQDCQCFYNYDDEKNIFDCKNRNLTDIPAQLQQDTDWLILTGNDIQTVCGRLDQLKNISRIELQHNQISQVCSETMEHFESIDYIDLSHNKLKTVPDVIESLPNTTFLRIGNNPYKCDCKILKDAEWLRGISVPHVLDKNSIVCATGKHGTTGMTVDRLTERNLGCIPPPIAAIVPACVTVVVVVIVILTIFRYLDVIKFKLFDKFNIRINEDQTENIEHMKFDALVAYRYGYTL